MCLSNTVAIFVSILGHRSCATAVAPCLSGSATMSVAEGPQAETTVQYQCKFCGMLYPFSAGRLHGKTFVCTPCHTNDRALRRNLGQQSDLGTFTPEESKDFFRKLLEKKKESPSGRLVWTTVRACMITALTERAIMSYRGEVECTELPLSVYVSQGWPEEVVKKCPSVWSDDYGVWCYKVPIRKQTWSQTYERMESKVLQQEQEASKKNTKGSKFHCFFCGPLLGDLKRY